MARYEFTSVFADEIRKYLSDRKAAGYNENSNRAYLIQFDRFCNEQGLTNPVFTTSVASSWLEQRDTESHTTHYSRINASKHFLTYLSIKGYDVYVVRDIKYKGTDFQPHIYTDDEVQRYFAAVDSYYSVRNRKDALQYPVLFRILYQSIHYLEVEYNKRNHYIYHFQGNRYYLKFLLLLFLLVYNHLMTKCVK